LFAKFEYLQLGFQVKLFAISESSYL